MMQGYFYYCQESTALEAGPEPKGWSKFSDQQFSAEKSNSVLPWVSYNRDNTVLETGKDSPVVVVNAGIC